MGVLVGVPVGYGPFPGVIPCSYHSPGPEWRGGGGHFGPGPGLIRGDPPPTHPLTSEDSSSGGNETYRASPSPPPLPWGPPYAMAMAQGALKNKRKVLS